MNVRAGRFPLFDSLRAIAALSVVVFHAALFAGAARSGSPLRAYTSHLDVGVTVFFLISGFLLYRPFVKARLESRGLPHVGVYAWRRVLRIVPPYWVALTVVAIWIGLSHEVFTGTGVPTYYGFAQIYSARTASGGIDQAWTLCVEVTFYAFLPLWAVAMRWLGRRVVATELAALVLLALASVAYKVWATGQVNVTSLRSAPYLMPLPNFLDDFALGMAIAVVSVWSEGRERLPRPLAAVARFSGACWLVALAAFWAVSTRIGYDGDPATTVTRRMFLERHALYAVVALGLLLPAVFGDQAKGAVRRLLASRALLYVGLVSYALYLYHLAVLTAFDRRLHDRLVDLLPSGLGWRFAGFFLVGVAGGTAIATASYYLVERPALSLKRLVGPLVEPAPREATAEPAPAAPLAPHN